MDNETKDMLQQLLAGQQGITQRLDKLEQDLSEVKQLAANTAKEVASIKKDTTITRVAVNELISWTDTAASVIEVPFLKAK